MSSDIVEGLAFLKAIGEVAVQNDGTHISKVTGRAIMATVEHIESAHNYQSALAAIRETHAIVPREPTDAMVEAGAVERCGWATTAECADMRKCYTAMIAAAEGRG